MTVEFNHAGCQWQANYALSEREDRNVLRLRAVGRPSREEYYQAKAIARDMLGKEVAKINT